MNSFYIKPGSLLCAKSAVIGTGENFKKCIEKGSVLLFLTREQYAEIDDPTLFIYRYVQDNRKCCIICTEEQFFKFFEVIYLGSVHESNDCDKNS